MPASPRPMACVRNGCEWSISTRSVFLEPSRPRTASIAPGGYSLLAAFDQATLPTVFAVGAPLELAPHQPAQSPKRHRVRILPSSLLHRMTSSHYLHPIFCRRTIPTCY